MGPKAGPGSFNNLAVTVDMPKGVFGRSAEKALEGGGSVKDARIPKPVVKKEGVEREPELSIPDHRPKAGLDEFTVGPEQVTVFLTGGGPQESGDLADDGSRFRGGLPLCPIVFCVFDYCVP